MRHFSAAHIGFAIALALVLVAFGPASVVLADMNDPLETRLAPDLVQALFPGADGIGAVAGDPPIAPVLTNGEIVGYLFSTHETVRPAGFFGASFDIIVALSADGIVVGHRSLEEFEPTIADNIVPQANVDGIIARVYGTHVRAIRRLVPRHADAVSGATVSAIVMANAVTNAATAVGYMKGMIDDAAGGVSVKRTDFVERSWADLIADGSVSELSLTYGDVREAFARQLGPDAQPDVEMGADDETFITLYAALATPPTIGANIMGQYAYRGMTYKANPRAQHFVIVSAGPYEWLPAETWMAPSVTRIVVVQNGREMPFSPAIIVPLERLAAEGAPAIQATARFTLSPRVAFSAMEPWTARVRINEIAEPGETQRRVDFDLPYQLPAAYVQGSDYALEEAGVKQPHYVGFSLLRESTLTEWQRAWVEKRWDLVALVALLAAVSFAVLWQSWISRSERRRQVIRYSLLGVTIVWLGWIAGGQLTIVSVINYARVLVAGLDWTTVLLDPLLLILSVYVVVSLVLWGRGVFCGWLCPFGALQEILNKVAVALRVPQLGIPAALHRRLWLIKYGVAAVIFGLAVYSLPAALTATEIEPFKTVMTAKFERSWPYVFYALVLLFAGLFIERLFCRFLCPLGAALAVFGKLRLLSPLKRRADCGSPCKLCEKQCPIDAIEPSGRINMTECFYCLDCQVLYYDDHTCPPLVAARKRRARDKAPRSPDLVSEPA